jgi:phosphoribosylanthranilate isomerase
MRVKICGITNYEDAIDTINSGADALGFVFYEPSPRYIDYDKTKQIISQLPPFIKTVGLFVNSTPQEINKATKYTGIDMAQLHFEVNEEFESKLDINYIKVVRVKQKSDLEIYSDEYRLVDAFVESYGGAGKRIQKDWFDGIDCSKIIIAGGLNSSNIEELKSYGFAGFDVSSGVEKSKGKKDIQKVQEFIGIIKD